MPPLVIAILGLLASLFIPLAYCKYGCPTGLLLVFVRRHGGKNRPGLQDGVALIFLALAFALYYFHDSVTSRFIPL